MTKRHEERPNARRSEDSDPLESSIRPIPKRRLTGHAPPRRSHRDDDVPEGHRPPHAERHTIHSKLREIVKGEAEDWDDYED